MSEFKMEFHSPLTEEEWNIITDAELERSEEIEFTTPSGKKVLYQKVKHGRWMPHNLKGHPIPWGYDCSVCGEWNVFGHDYIQRYRFCRHCGAKMDKKEEEK